MENRVALPARTRRLSARPRRLRAVGSWAGADLANHPLPGLMPSAGSRKTTRADRAAVSVSLRAMVQAVERWPLSPQLTVAIDQLLDDAQPAPCDDQSPPVGPRETKS